MHWVSTFGSLLDLTKKEDSGMTDRLFLVLYVINLGLGHEETSLDLLD